MRTRDRRERRRLILRLLQVSPLIPLMFNGLVWISVPGPLRGQMLTMRSYQRMESVRGMIDESMVEELVTSYLTTGVETFDSESQATRDELYRIGELMLWATEGGGGALYAADGSVQSFGWPADDPMFAAIAQADAEGKADYYAFAIAPDGPPPLVAQAEGAPDLLYTPEEALLEVLPDDYAAARGNPGAYSLPPTPTVDPGAIDEQWKVVWYSQSQGFIDRAPFNANLLYGGVGMGDDQRWTSIMGHVSDTGLYATLWVRGPLDMTGSSPDDDPLNDEAMIEFDPRDPAAEATLQRMARTYSCNVYLVGPIQLTCVPIWASPDNTDIASSLAANLDATTVASLVQQGNILAEERLIPVLGESADVIAATTSGFAAESTDPEGSSFTTPAPTVLTMAVIHPDDVTVPVAASLLDDLEDAALPFRTWVAMNMHWLLNTGIALLAVSLIVSPTAFIYERNLIARERLVEEMDRVQRDAHDKVYNRLSALSKRVEITSDELTTEVARNLNGVAKDIRETVSELQDILGDTRRQTARIAGVDPVRSQMEHVGRAQADRLGIKVVFAAPETLPAIASTLGWDLQCVLEEAITNAAKHGRAVTVWVDLDVRGETLELVVRDDGTGLRLASLDDLPATSTGLRGMRDRLAEKGGTLDIASDENGTTLVASVPLTPPQT